MIKAVFFDWFNTLARYEPPREELESQALKELGIDISPQKIMPALLVADKELYEESAVLPLRKRSPEEQAKMFTHHQETVLTGVGVNVRGQPDLLAKFMKGLQQISQGMHFVLFDDVLPTMKALKEQNLILGLLTNLDRDMKPLCHELGLEAYIDFTVSSGEIGVDKPAPPIFLAALRQAGVNASEATHIGDQYSIDVVGALGVGITPILLDRYDLYPEVRDCPRIRSLTGLIKHLQSTLGLAPQ